MPVNVLKTISLLISSILLVTASGHGQELRGVVENNENIRQQKKMCEQNFSSSLKKKYKEIYYPIWGEGEMSSLRGGVRSIFGLSSANRPLDENNVVDGFDPISSLYHVIDSGKVSVAGWKYANGSCLIVTKGAVEIGKTYKVREYVNGDMESIKIEFHLQGPENPTETSYRSNAYPKLCLYLSHTKWSGKSDYDTPAKNCNYKE